MHACLRVDRSMSDLVFCLVPNKSEPLPPPRRRLHSSSSSSLSSLSCCRRCHCRHRADDEEGSPSRKRGPKRGGVSKPSSHEGLSEGPWRSWPATCCKLASWHSGCRRPSLPPWRCELHARWPRSLAARRRSPLGGKGRRFNVDDDDDDYYYCYFIVIITILSLILLYYY